MQVKLVFGVVIVNLLIAVFNLACLANGVSLVTLLSNDTKVIECVDQQTKPRHCKGHLHYRGGNKPRFAAVAVLQPSNHNPAD